MKAAGSTQVKVCVNKCKSEYQDTTYGKGKRVHNVGKGEKDRPPKVYCTVCNHVSS